MPQAIIGSIIILAFSSGILAGIVVGNRAWQAPARRMAARLLVYEEELGRMLTALHLGQDMFLEDALKDYRARLERVNEMLETAYNEGRREGIEERS